MREVWRGEKVNKYVGQIQPGAWAVVGVFHEEANFSLARGVLLHMLADRGSDGREAVWS